MLMGDRRHRVSFAYAMNRMLAGFDGDPRAEPLRLAFNEIARTL